MSEKDTADPAEASLACTRSYHQSDVRIAFFILVGRVFFGVIETDGDRRVCDVDGTI
jgi:hypothetical protein